MHGQDIMYEAVQVADAPAGPPSSSAAAACLLSSSASSFAAAAAALAAAQQAAALGLPSVQLDAPAGSSATPYAAAVANSPLPGLAKTLAAETGVAVLLQQQQEAAATRVALQTKLTIGQQPSFNELDTRCASMCYQLLTSLLPIASMLQLLLQHTYLQS
jgi:hypothetical protein